MQIKEVQEKLKISSYTLRYYEKMGLIQPYRDEMVIEIIVKKIFTK